MKRKKLKDDYLWDDKRFIIDDYHRVTSNEDKTIKGYRYRLANKLTQEERDYILSFNNTIIGEAHMKYAPELKFDTVIILNKCIR